MTVNWQRIAAGGVAIIASGSFFLGRHVEEKALAARAQTKRASLSQASSAHNAPSYRQLAIVELLALPFGEFYEALRAAPGEARAKWGAELEKMPAGPRRTSATIAFYKLLVQFDPKAAVKAVSEIKEKDLQDLAISCLASAAPGFAMRDVAELIVNVPPGGSGNRDYFSDVIRQWLAIDPAAVARFLTEHPRDENLAAIYSRELIVEWAAVDPAAAKEWMENSPAMMPPDAQESFITGWYLNDSSAAVAYVLAHATEPALGPAVSGVLSALYLDSRENAKSFIEALPTEEARRKAIHDAFEWMPNFGTAEETGEPQRTPRAIADWLIQFPPRYWKGTLRRMFEYWADQPPAEAFAWIQQQAPGIRDAVAAEYSVKTFEQPRPESISAVFQTADPSLRDKLLTAMIRNTQRSSDEWQDSVAKAALSPAQKDQVLQIVAMVQAEQTDESDQGSEK